MKTSEVKSTWKELSSVEMAQVEGGQAKYIKVLIDGVVYYIEI
jgi:hypothetical protein